nr:hypothetical protein [uncultured Niameybacter sp.]
MEGTEDYQVAVKLDDNEKIIYSYCNCPYDYGPVCKHEAAAYYKLKDYLDDEDEKQTIRKKQNIEEVLNILTKQQLIQLLLPIIKRDVTLEEKVLIQYGKTDTTQELKRMERLIDAIENKYIGESGYIYYEREDEFIDKMWELVHYIEPLSGSEEKVMLALDMLLLLLERGIALYEYIEDDTGFMGEFINDILCRISGFVAESIAYDEQVKEQIIHKIIQKVKEEKFQEWIDYGTQLLQSVLIYGSNARYREMLYKELGQQLESADSNTIEAISVMLFELLQYHGTQQEIEQYIEEHLEMDTFREKFLQNLMEKQDYEKAIQVALEGEEKNKEHTWGLDKWKKARYDAYKAIRDIKNQKALGKEFLLRSYFEYYEDLKELHKEDYNNFYSNLKEELRGKTGAGEYSIFRKLVEKENDIEELMNIVRKEPDTLSKYIKLLMNTYGDEVLALYRKNIENRAEKACSRNMYQDVCYMIADYRRYENEQNVKMLIEKFKKEHKRRPAFIDELSKIE